MRHRLIAIAPLVLATCGFSAVVLAGGSGPTSVDPQQTANGGKIYKQYCASCHGINGEGAPHWDEVNEHGELPPPPHNVEGHTWKHSDAMLYRMVGEGWRDPFNKTKRLTMPAFRNTLAPEEIEAVITYLKTFWTAEQRQFQREETAARGGFPGGKR